MVLIKWYREGHGLNVEKCVESLKSVIKINGACFNNMGKLNVCLFKVDLLITLCIYITSYSINACCMWLITNYNQHNIYHTNFNTTLKEDNWYRFCMIILRCKRRPRWHWTIHCVRHISVSDVHCYLVLERGDHELLQQLEQWHGLLRPDPPLLPRVLWLQLPGPQEEEIQLYPSLRHRRVSNVNSLWL